MTPDKAIEFMNQIRIILLNDKSWLESTREPINEAFNMAIDALEKQIPKVPVMDYGFAEKTRQAMIRNGDKEKAEYKTDCCPICKRPLGVSKFVQSKTGLRFGDLYCKHCGQAILWE